MMYTLHIKEGENVQIESVSSLPVATLAKFKAQCADFLTITDYKAVLEEALRNFVCLTVGDLITVAYGSVIYKVRAIETKPESAVSLIGSNMDVSKEKSAVQFIFLVFFY